MCINTHNAAKLHLLSVDKCVGELTSPWNVGSCVYNTNCMPPRNSISIHMHKTNEEASLTSEYAAKNTYTQEAKIFSENKKNTFNGMGPRLGNGISPCFFTFLRGGM